MRCSFLLFPRPVFRVPVDTFRRRRPGVQLFFFPRLLLQIDAHEDDVNAVAFADSSSQLLFSGSDDALCKVWDRRTLREDRPQPVGHLAGHRDGITFIHSKVGGRGQPSHPLFIISDLPFRSLFSLFWKILYFAVSRATPDI